MKSLLSVFIAIVLSSQAEALSCKGVFEKITKPVTQVANSAYEKVKDRPVVQSTARFYSKVRERSLVEHAKNTFQTVKDRPIVQSTARFYSKARERSLVEHAKNTFQTASNSIANVVSHSFWRIKHEIDSAALIYVTKDVHKAFNDGNVEAVKAFQKRGRDLNELNEKGNPPLKYAIANSHVGAIKDLLSLGADPNTKDTRGNVAAHYAAQKNFPEVIELLKDHNADFNAVNNTGETPSYIAVLFGNKGALEALAKNGVKIAESPDVLRNPLYATIIRALHTGRTDILEVLVKNGGDLNKRTPEGYTISQLVALSKTIESPKIFKKIQELGADINAKNAHGHSLVDMLVGQKEVTILKAVKDLLGADLDLNPYLYKAVQSGDAKVAEILLDAGVNVHAKGGENQRAAIHYAVQGGDKSMIEFLVKKRGADINAVDAHGYSPLHLLREPGENMVQFLVDLGANPNQVDKEGETLAHLAVYERQSDAEALIRDLAEANASFNIKNKAGGSTATHFAALSGNWALVDVFRKVGADFDIKDNAGRTPNDIIKFHSQHNLNTLRDKEGDNKDTDAEGSKS